jgi:hypothetical protein
MAFLRHKYLGVIEIVVDLLAAAIFGVLQANNRLRACPFRPTNNDIRDPLLIFASAGTSDRYLKSTRWFLSSFKYMRILNAFSPKH